MENCISKWEECQWWYPESGLTAKAVTQSLEKIALPQTTTGTMGAQRGRLISNNLAHGHHTYSRFHQQHHPWHQPNYRDRKHHPTAIFSHALNSTRKRQAADPSSSLKTQIKYSISTATTPNTLGKAPSWQFLGIMCPLQHDWVAEKRK